MRVLSLGLVFVSLMGLMACAGDSGEHAANTAGGDAPAASTHAADDAPNNTVASTPAATAARGAAPAKTYSGFDIAGIYLGMSPEEVTAALQAYDPSIAIKQDSINFTYNALGQRHRTDSFAHYMGGTVPGGALSLDVRFSYPPEPLSVVMVSRGHRQQVEPISQALYVESLVEKYGTPAWDSGSTTTRDGVERILEWPIGNGSIQCLPEGAKTDSTPPILTRIARRLPGASVESVEDCISMLRYVLRGDPVLQASGVMFDVAAAAKAEFANQHWIQSLIDEKSQTGTERPRL